MNNDPYIVMNGAVFLVVDNNNTNAITTSGTGGNIVSENENSKVRWRIGTATGSYVLPWYSATNAGGMKIPTTFNITGAGVAGTHVDFSTFRTADNNTTYPSYVTHMYDNPSATFDNSLNVVDRFWIFETSTYTTKPDVSMTITYDNSAAEIGAPNAITEAGLVAQRFRTSDGTWGGVSYGAATPASRIVGPFAVPNADLQETWTLTENDILLPVELVNFNVDCEQNSNLVKWSTASESNNSHFIIERSTNGFDYLTVGQVPGSGNSLVSQNYYFTDNYSGDAFYRLTQVDLNDVDELLGVKKSNCEIEGNTIYTFQDDNNLSISAQLKQNENLNVLLYDLSGKLIYSSSSKAYIGSNSFLIPTRELASSTYLLKVVGDFTTFNEKIVIQ
jgi:hypothetical protein